MPKRTELGEMRIFAIFAADVVGRYIHHHNDEQEVEPDFHLLHTGGVESSPLGMFGLQLKTRVSGSSLPTEMIITLSFANSRSCSASVHAEVYYPGDQPAIKDPRIWKGTIGRSADGSLHLVKLVYCK